ncbi:unnamed protein product [Trifolium pratense]|uniref:Uncharacterized protein n=1 Tax=Trifolium pratense TaxID=57577 RepID=A0ACB0JRL3_TRIPR|nr:unnamed protein product [Trifolium pratense]
MPAEGERICSPYTEDGFTMYEMAFKGMGYRLSFNNLEAEIFGRLKVLTASSKRAGVHPGIPDSLSVSGGGGHSLFILLYLQNPTTESRGPARLGVLEAPVKQDIQDVCGVCPGLQGEILRGEAGDGVCLKLSLYGQTGIPRGWVSSIGRGGGAGFEKLKTYVDGFKPCKVMTSLGEVALDKYGKPRIEPRFVNTKLLLSCKIVSAENTLLGRMADLASELMRTAAEHKGDKSKKKARKSRPGVSNVLVAEQAASGSISQSSPVLSSAGTPTGRAKRQREEQMTPIVDLSKGDGGFVLPACLSNRSFFDKNPLQVPASEKNYVLSVSSAARQNQLNEDIAVVIQLAETALVLNEGGPTHEVEKLAARNAKLEGHIVKLEGELIDLRGKQENYGNLLEEARVTREELEKTKKELEEVKTQGAEEKKKLEEVIGDLQSKFAPAADDAVETSRLVSRADLVKEIKRLGGLMLASMVHGWKNAVAQLKVVNSEHGLITEGIHRLKKVENGQIVIPEEYRQMALEEEKEDEEDDDDEDDVEEVVEEEKAPDGNQDGHDESN